MSGLNPKQAQFVREYLIDLNATQAAKRAGYSEKTAYAQGQRLLKHAEVAAALSEAQAKRAERTEISADRVLHELAKIGFGDIRKVFTPSGNLLSPAEMDDEVAATIASVEVVTRRIPGGDGEEAEVEHIHKIKAWDKLGALTQIGRHLGMFTDKTEHTGGVTLVMQSLDDQL